jgi:hypothetical protein
MTYFDVAFLVALLLSSLWIDTILAYLPTLVTLCFLAIAYWFRVAYVAPFATLYAVILWYKKLAVRNGREAADLRRLLAEARDNARSRDAEQGGTVTRLRAKLNEMSEELTACKERVACIQAVSDEEFEYLCAAYDSVRSLKAQLKAEHSRRESLADDLSRARYNAVRLDKENADLRSETNALKHIRYQFEKQVKDADAENTRLKAEKTKLEREAADARAESARLKAELDKLKPKPRSYANFDSSGSRPGGFNSFGSSGYRFRPSSGSYGANNTYRPSGFGGANHGFNFRPNPVFEEDPPHKVYDDAWKKMEADTSSPITLSALPNLRVAGMSLVDSIKHILPKPLTKEMVRHECLRWHSDKFVAKFKDRLSVSMERDLVMNEVHEVTIALTDILKSFGY